MPGLRHRRHVKDRPAEVRAIPTEAEVRLQFRPAAACTPGAPRKVKGDFLQSDPADYESNSGRFSSRADLGSDNKS